MMMVVLVVVLVVVERERGMKASVQQEEGARNLKKMKNRETPAG